MKRNVWKKLMAMLLTASMLTIGMTGCGSSQEASNSDESTQVPTDYSDESNWMKIPEVTKEIDTFYIYPTAYLDEADDALDICTIDNEDMRTEANGCYETQASVYAESTNVFAPYYRQLNGIIAFSAPAEERDALLETKPKDDIFAAVDYYFENYNEGRPFIIAAHSQGSEMLTFLLSEYFAEHSEYLDRMIAAYALGFSVTDEYLNDNPHLKFAEGEDDTGVIISWNTEGEGNKDQDNFVVEEGAISINPLNWKLDDTYAPKEECLGTRIEQDDGSFEVFPQAADAQLDLERGVVVTHQDVIDPMPEDMGFGPESYHGGDYTLWYTNIQKNVQKRIDAYLNAI